MIDVTRMTTQELWDLADVMGAELSERGEMHRPPVRRATSIIVGTCIDHETGERLIGFDFVDQYSAEFAHGHVGMQQAQEIVGHIVRLMKCDQHGGRSH